MFRSGVYQVDILQRTSSRERSQHDASNSSTILFFADLVSLSAENVLVALGVRATKEADAFINRFGPVSFMIFDSLD